MSITGTKVERKLYNTTLKVSRLDLDIKDASIRVVTCFCGWNMWLQKWKASWGSACPSLTHFKGFLTDTDAQLPNVWWTEIHPRASQYLVWAWVSCWLNLSGHCCAQDCVFSSSQELSEAGEECATSPVIPFHPIKKTKPLLPSNHLTLLSSTELSTHTLKHAQIHIPLFLLRVLIVARLLSGIPRWDVFKPALLLVCYPS